MGLILVRFCNLARRYMGKAKNLSYIMTTFKKKLETFFVYFFTGISILVVVLGVQRAKHSDALAVAPSNDDSNESNQQASIWTAVTGTKVLAASETVSAVGKSYDTPWGKLVTSIKVRDGKIVSVEIPTLPNSPQSVYAKPILIDETLKAGSANVQAVTGATITSNAFKASLESALAIAKSKNPKSVAGIPKTTSKNTSAQTTGIKITETQIVDVYTPVVPAGVSGTFSGNAVQTPWGNAVSSVTLVNGKITNVAMPTVPNSPPSVYAEPYLVQQALYSGSANIQGVSGATITSDAFKVSLESALSKARASGAVVATTIQQPVTPPPAPVQTPVIVPPVIAQPTTPAQAIAPASVSGTFTGTAYSTKWGPASASVTFTNGRITSATMPQVPQSPPSIQAEPFLIQQALSAGSANIQGVSGATVVSDAFRLSLESAIAQASAQGTVFAPAPTTISTTPTTAPRVRRQKDDDDDD